MEIFISFEQGGYHELQNEPDGVKEKVLEEVVSFIDGHLDLVVASSIAEEVKEEAATQEAAVAPETTNPAVVTDSKAKM